MKKLILLSGILFFAIAVKAQVRKIATSQNKKQIENRILYKKSAVQIEPDSAQFPYPNAYRVALYFSNFYLSYADFHPIYIIDGTKPDTKVEYDLYNASGKQLARYVSGNNYLPADPYNRHPVPFNEVPVHGGHKILEFMTQPCTLRITILPVQEDTVRFSRFVLDIKYAQSYYPNDYNSATGTYNGAEYSNAAGNFITIWYRSGQDIVLTKKSPTVTLHFQYNKNLVAANAAGNNTVFMPVY